MLKDVSMTEFSEIVSFLNIFVNVKQENIGHLSFDVNSTCIFQRAHYYYAYFMHKFTVMDILSHRIRISEILPWRENLTSPMLSYQGCHVRATYIGCIETHAHCRQVTSSCEIVF